jgi:hypothetical protein
MTSKEIRAMLIASREKNQADFNEFLLIQEWMKKENGKVINRWMDKRLPEGWEIQWRAGMAHIKMPSGNSHLISYGEALNADNLPRYDSCYGEGAANRIQQIDGYLNNPEAFTEMAEMYLQAATLYAKLQKTVNDIWPTSHKNPIHYELVKAAGFADGVFSDIYFKQSKK